MFVYFLLWLLCTVALSMITTLYLELEWGCDKFPTTIMAAAAAEGEDEDMQQCFTYAINNCTSEPM